MKKMVNAFSDYARSPRARLQSLDLNQQIGDVLALYRAAQPASAIEARLDEHLPLLSADPDRLRQVLHNLIKNALEASADTARPRVFIETRGVSEAGGEFVELSIRDEGTGFPDNILDQVFEPYVTTKAEGTGLGLAIVKKIVEEHGGMVWAENNAGAGACVIVRFPAVRLESTDSATDGETPQPDEHRKQVV